MSKLDIHVGGGFERVRDRLVEAWDRLERGETVSENHLTFASWEALAGVMTTDRLAILRHLHRAPTDDVESVARALERDTALVDRDVAALLSAGLLERAELGFRADYNEIRTVIAL